MKNRFRSNVNINAFQFVLILMSLLPSFKSAIAACTINSVGVVFSPYSALQSLPNNSGVGTVTVTCTSGEVFPVITLTTGQHSSTTQRFMTSSTSPDKLGYNIFTDAARTIVWGDGKGQGSAVTVQSSTTNILSLYGQIGPGQDAGVGYYGDFLSVTVNF